MAASSAAAPADLLRGATTELAAAGVASPRVDAELLLAHAAGVPRSRLVLADVSPDQASAFSALVGRRAAREPLQYLLGSAAFRHVEVAVGPGVFIPRPETELLPDLVADALAGARLVVDLCSGSGALALAVATERPGLRVIAVEDDPDALPWLRRNAADRVEVRAASVGDLSALGDLAGDVDVVLCNPPYVPDGTPVGAEVAHDPPHAVFAGADGLDLIPTVSRTALALLTSDGVLALEHDETQGESVPALLRADGWRDVRDHPDLTGRPRFTTALRH